MKRLFFSLILVVGLSITSFAQTDSKQTEEYAIVDVFEQEKTKVIRVTKGLEPTTERLLQKGKTEVYGDFTQVIVELDKLNKQGYELLNVSTAYTTLTGFTTPQSGVPRFTFMM